MRIFREGERWADLRALIDARQDLVKEPAERLDLLAQMAEIDETLLDDPDHAIGCYERMLGVNPADLRAYRALERHYAARERWRDLEELLGTRGSFAPAAEVPDITHRRAELRAARLDDVDGALNLVESIVRTVPGHEGARRLLEKLLSVPDQRLRVARILEPLYESSGAWARLVAVLEVQREALQGSEAAAMLARIADLQENKLQARTAALATWRQVLAVEPTHADALAEIERLATLLERFSELVDVYQELAFNRDTRRHRGPRRSAVARGAALRRAPRQPARRDRRLEAGAEPGRRQPGDGEAGGGGARGAVRRDRRHRVAGQDPAPAGALGRDVRRAQGAAVPDRRARGEVAGRHHGRGGDAAVDPRDRRREPRRDRQPRADLRGRLEPPPARRDAAPAHRSRARRRARARSCGGRSRTCSSATSATSTRRSPPASASSTRTPRTPARSTRWRASTTSRGGTATASASSSAGWAWCAANRRRRATPPRPRCCARSRASTRGRSAIPANALGHWRQILGTAPGDADALAALERFMQPSVETGLRLAAAQALEPIYERAGRWPELAEVIQVYVEAQGDPRARVAELSRLATLAGDAARRARGGVRVVRPRDPRRARRRDAGRLLDSYERLAARAVGGGAPRRGRGALPRHHARRARRAAAAAPGSLRRRGRARQGRPRAGRPSTSGACSIACPRTTRRSPRSIRSTARRATPTRSYEILIRRAELAKDPGAEQPAARADRRAGREAARARRRGDRRLRARAGAGAARSRRACRRSIACTPSPSAGRDLTRFLVGDASSAGCPSARWSRIRFRLAQIAHDRRHDKESALEQLRAVLRASPEHAGAIDDARGDARRRRRAGRGRRAARAGLRGPRRLARADPRRRDPPAAGRGSRRSAWPGPSASRACTRSSSRTSTTRSAGTARSFRRRRPSASRPSSCCAWPASSTAGRTSGTCSPTTLPSELGDSPEVLEIMRRAAEIFDLRLGDRDEARKYYRRLHETRPDDREVALLFENALERWEAWLELRELVDEQAGRAVDASGQEGASCAAAPSSTRSGSRTRRARCARCARSSTSRLDTEPARGGRDRRRRRARAAAARQRRVARPVGAPGVHAGARARRRATATRSRCAWPTCSEKRVDDLSGAIDRYAEILERTPGHREAIAALERHRSTIPTTATASP